MHHSIKTLFQRIFSSGGMQGACTAPSQEPGRDECPYPQHGHSDIQSGAPIWWSADQCQHHVPWNTENMYSFNFFTAFLKFLLYVSALFNDLSTLLTEVQLRLMNFQLSLTDVQLSLTDFQLSRTDVRLSSTDS